MAKFNTLVYLRQAPGETENPLKLDVGRSAIRDGCYIFECSDGHSINVPTANVLLIDYRPDRFTETDKDE